MKILLINPPWYRFFDEELAAYPIGLSYIAGVMEKNGFNVIVYNADHETQKKTSLFISPGSKMLSRHEQYQAILKDMNHVIWQDIRETIEKHSPDVIGLSVMTPKYGAALNVARLAKKINTNTIIVLGGIHPTIMSEETIKNECVDFVVRGEGEYTFLELMKKIKNGKKDFENVLGISYKKEEKPFHNPDRPLIENLDDLPNPSRHLLLDKETYHPNAFSKIFSTRGCPYQCTFCGSNKIWKRKVRFRSPEKVVDEIISVKDDYGSKHFVFEDDSFTIDKNFVNSVCDLLIEQKANVEWSCETRANLVTDELIKKMKKAGCTGIVIGVESGSPRILKKIKKGVTIEEIENAARIIKKNSLLFSAFFMIGFPDETEDDINKTIELMKKIKPFTAVLSIFTPYPDTEAYGECLNYGLIPDNINWSTFYHQSPEMHFVKNITKERFNEIVRHTEKIFDEHNKLQRRSLVMKHPIYTIRRIIKNKYYTPKNMLRLFKMIR